MIGSLRRGHGLASAVLALAAVAVLTAFVVVAAPAHASVSRAFAIRYQNNQHGDILLRGNTLLTCPASANCTSAINRSATGTDLNNNSYAMVLADVDGSGNTTNSSSSATVTLPSGSSVLWAGLYWSAYTTSGNGNTRTAPPAGTAKDRLLLKAPGDSSYRTITVGTGRDSYTDDGTAPGAPYVSFAEVTDVVRAAGSGVYTAADIYAATGNDSYGAWSLVTVIQDPAAPKRNLTVFDGFGTVQNQTGDTTIDIPLSGFTTRSSGTVDAQLGTVAFEGDAGSTGDQLQVVPPAGSGVGTSTLSDAQNPADNYFNSTVSDGGTAVTGRTPDGNTFGFDADVYSSSVLLGNGATSATLRLNTGGETYFPAVATFAADIIAPDLVINQTASVSDVNSDARTGPGDRIDYTVTVTNNGNDDAENTVLSSPIPAGTSYVPGSAKIAGSAMSDAADGDQAEVSGNSLAVRLGTGAGGSGGSGGELLQGASRTYTYSVLITGPFASAGDSVTGSSSAAYDDRSTGRFTGSSNLATTTISQAVSDLQVTNVASPKVVQSNGSRTVTWTATVTNNGPDPETAPVLTQALPSGVNQVSNSGSCTGTTTLTCSLSSIASGASAFVTFTADLPSTASDPSTATASVSGAGTDPVSSNNSAAGNVGVNDPPVAAGDTANLPSTTLSVDVDAAANDTDPDGDPLALNSAGPASHGTATLVNGKVRYTLTDVHFTGTDTVPYSICDDRAGCTTGTITVTVAAHTVSDLAVTQTTAPAVLQRDGTRKATWVVVITNNGPDAEAHPVLTQALPAGVTGIGVNGARCTAANTTATCALSPLALGDSITVTFGATLPATAPDPATATASVTGGELDSDTSNNQASAGVGVNTAPVAKPDNGKLSRSVISVVLNVAANDIDADHDPLTVTAVTTPGHGTATITGGKILYTITDLGFEGDDSFTYTVCDDRGGCATATATLAIAAHDHAPAAVNDSARTSLGKPVSIMPLANDKDVDGDKLSIARIVSQPEHGSAVISGTKIVYQPADGYAGTDRLSYETCDPSGLCDRAQISITVTSPPPVANTDTATVRPGGTLVVDPIANDIDSSGGTLGSVKIVQQPKYGHAYVDANGKIHYTASARSVPGGKVTIGYQTCSSSGACAESSIVLAVSGRPVSGSSGSGSATSSAGSGGGGGPLAFTGANVGRLVGLAFLLMLLGTAFITASRRHARPALAWRSYGTKERYRLTPPPARRR